jgi:hypothetical protein
LTIERLQWTPFRGVRELNCSTNLTALALRRLFYFAARWWFLLRRHFARKGRDTFEGEAQLRSLVGLCPLRTSRTFLDVHVRAAIGGSKPDIANL